MSRLQLPELLDIQTAIAVTAAGILFWFIHTYIKFRRVLASVDNHPGYRCLVSQATTLNALLPAIPGVIMGKNHGYHDNFAIFKYFGWDIHTSMAIFPKVQVTIHVGGAANIKEVTSNRHKWPKPLEAYEILNYYGQNIVTTEGEEWKKNRKITAPAFTDRNNRIVWDETLDIMRDLLDNVWGDQDIISTDHIVADMSMPLTLFIISAAGFGQRINFTASDFPPPGHKMTFRDAIHHVASNVLFRLVAPNLFWKLTQKLRTIDLAFTELNQYIHEMTEARRTGEKEERYDLLSGLLDANDEGKDVAQLSMEELTGNIFIFLIAGHETTAHTLAWMLAMFALYPEEQEKLYQHVKKTMPKGRWPTYEEMPLFTHSLAALYETLRMFPPVEGIPKQAAEDTFLMASNTETGEMKAVPVPKGTNIIISTPGLHYNPSYWKDPYEFRPERFLQKDWPRDAWLPFNGGARACLGRKFSETETVAIISVLIDRYSFHIKEEPQFANETFGEKKARILRARSGLTHTPERIPIVFKRRK